MLSDLSAFSLVILMCSEKFSLGPNVTPRILGFLTVGISVLLILRFNAVLYSAGSGVKRVAVDLSGFRMSLFSIAMCRFLLGKVGGFLVPSGICSGMRLGSCHRRRL